MKRKSLIILWKERINLEADDLGNMNGDFLAVPKSYAESLGKNFKLARVSDPRRCWRGADNDRVAQSRRDNSGGGMDNNSESP